MADYRLTKRASNDLSNIAAYTIQSFGIDQSRIYRDSLKRCFGMLAKTPSMGRSAEHVQPLLRCFQHKSHVIFYKPDAHGILVVRVLHNSMDLVRHL